MNEQMAVNPQVRAVLKDTGFRVMNSLPRAEYFSQLIETLMLLAVLFIAGIALIVLGMKKAAVKITKPILELNGAAQQLAGGNFDVELHVTASLSFSLILR